MYEIKTTVMFDSGRQATLTFDTWELATQWVFEMACEDDCPSVVTMTKESV